MWIIEFYMWCTKSNNNTHDYNHQVHTDRPAAAFLRSSWRHPGSVHQWPPPAPWGRSSSSLHPRWTLSRRRASERFLCEENGPECCQWLFKVLSLCHQKIRRSHPTYLRVSSSVANLLQSWQHHALVMVGVQLELCLGIITVLNKSNLFKTKKKKVRIKEWAAK